MVLILDNKLLRKIKWVKLTIKVNSYKSRTKTVLDFYSQFKNISNRK